MSDPSAMWGGGTYERIAERFAPVHDELVARLEPGSGVRWLDLAPAPARSLCVRLTRAQR